MTDIYSLSFPIGGDSCDYVGPSWEIQHSFPSEDPSSHRQIALVRYDDIVTSLGDWGTDISGRLHQSVFPTHLQHDQVMKLKQVSSSGL